MQTPTYVILVLNMSTKKTNETRQTYIKHHEHDLEEEDEDDEELLSDGGSKTETVFTSLIGLPEAGLPSLPG
jgi:hypothetical protein